MRATGQRVRLRSGDEVLLRPLRRSDGPGLAAMFQQMSEDSRYRRFFTLKPRLSPAALESLTSVDHHDHEALVAVAPGTGELVGVARFVRDPDQPDTADLAMSVVDAWQHRGLGTVLLQRLSQRAAEEGVSHFTAQILAENRPMLQLARRTGEADLSRVADGTVQARIEVPEPREEPAGAVRSRLLVPVRALLGRRAG